jgi:hypothetical protein
MHVGSQISFPRIRKGTPVMYMYQQLTRFHSTRQRVIVSDMYIRKDSCLSVRIAELRSEICADHRPMCYTFFSSSGAE